MWRIFLLYSDIYSDETNLKASLQQEVLILSLPIGRQALNDETSIAARMRLKSYKKEKTGLSYLSELKNYLSGSLPKASILRSALV